MAIQKQPRQIIQAPTGLTQDNMLAIRNGFIKHFKSILTPELLIANRKASYALIINGKDTTGVILEQMVGSENAKLITTDVLETLLGDIATVPELAVTPSTTYQA